MAKNQEKAEETALQAAGETALAPAELFESKPGEGFEGMTQDDLVVPFIKLLQKGSPEVDEDKGEYMEDAEVGMFLDAATHELMEEVNFVVCHYHRAMVEWRSRDDGGGFVATGPDQKTVDQQLEWCRYRIGFYGSTRSYHGVFNAHGWDDLGMNLHSMSREGKWKEMAAEISDEVLNEFTAAATYDGIAKAVEERFGGIADSITMDFAAGGYFTVGYTLGENVWSRKTAAGL